jgi:hypothetical protein
MEQGLATGWRDGQSQQTDRQTESQAVFLVLLCLGFPDVVNITFHIVIKWHRDPVSGSPLPPLSVSA